MQYVGLGSAEYANMAFKLLHDLHIAAEVIQLP